MNFRGLQALGDTTKSDGLTRIGNAKLHVVQYREAGSTFIGFSGSSTTTRTTL